MKPTSADLVSLALRDPGALPAWPLSRWDELVRQARRANLLARIAVALEQRQLLDAVPRAPRAHLQSAAVLAQAHREAIHREVAYIATALAPLGIELVFLKGAAYVLAGLPAADGRLFSDVDLLVPEHALTEVEGRLRDHGWHTAEEDEYYDRYYREWGHELPPMQHGQRQTVVDVHHAILPRTARYKPDSSKLLSAAQAVSGRAGMRVLAPADMVLHSATHLFQNEELSNGLRDLADLDSLLRHFGGSTQFWAHLPGRAADLDLGRPLYYGLRYAQRILGTPIPDHVLTECAERARRPALPGFMDTLWLRVLRPDHPTVSDWLTGAARGLLYARAHYMRMPPHLLLYHFVVKTIRDAKKKARTQGAAQPLG